jgi:hypothetical protein
MKVLVKTAFSTTTYNVKGVVVGNSPVEVEETEQIKKAVKGGILVKVKPEKALGKEGKNVSKSNTK